MDSDRGEWDLQGNKLENAYLKPVNEMHKPIENYNFVITMNNLLGI